MRKRKLNPWEAVMKTRIFWPEESQVKTMFGNCVSLALMHTMTDGAASVWVARWQDGAAYSPCQIPDDHTDTR